MSLLNNFNADDVPFQTGPRLFVSRRLRATTKPKTAKVPT